MTRKATVSKQSTRMAIAVDGRIRDAARAARRAGYRAHRKGKALVVSFNGDAPVRVDIRTYRVAHDGVYRAAETSR